LLWRTASAAYFLAVHCRGKSVWRKGCGGEKGKWTRAWQDSYSAGKNLCEWAQWGRERGMRRLFSCKLKIIRSLGVRRGAMSAWDQSQLIVNATPLIPYPPSLVPSCHTHYTIALHHVYGRGLAHGRGWKEAVHEDVEGIHHTSFYTISQSCAHSVGRRMAR